MCGMGHPGLDGWSWMTWERKEGLSEPSGERVEGGRGEAWGGAIAVGARQLECQKKIRGGGKLAGCRQIVLGL